MNVVAVKSSNCTDEVWREFHASQDVEKVLSREGRKGGREVEGYDAGESGMLQRKLECFGLNVQNVVAKLSVFDAFLVS